MFSKLLLASALLFSCAANAQWKTAFFKEGGTMTPANIPWSKLDTVVHFYVSPGHGGSCVADGSVDMSRISTGQSSALVSAGHAAGKKVLISIVDSDACSNAYADDTASGLLSTFIASIATMLSARGYDGVDLDWENSIDTTKYTNLITGLRAALPTATITIDLVHDTPFYTVAVAGYSYLDQLNVMCYDEWVSEFNNHSRAWYNSHIYAASSGKSSCDATMTDFTYSGVPAAKLGVGIAYYTERFPGVTLAGQTTSTAPTLVGYNTLVTDATRWKPENLFYDITYGANYLSSSSLTEFDSYTGVEEITNFVAWGKSKGYGGFMVYTLNYEWLSSQTGDARYPLTTALANAVSYVDPHWVSPTGAAVSWSACSGSTPLSGTAACTLAQANTNAIAGDTVYLRGGSGDGYNFATNLGSAIAPTHSGTCPSTCPGGAGASRITFAAYNGEVPVLAQSNHALPNGTNGLLLTGVSWIKITGITFQDFSHYYVLENHGSSYNEISHCNFIASADFIPQGDSIRIGMTDDVTMGWVTHNWIHHNYISTRVYYPASCEGQDALDIGNDGYNGALYDDNNTVEYNYIEYGGHATMAVNSHRNVVVGNTVHNEPWKPSCTVWQTSTSASSVAVGTGSRTFTTQAGLSYSALGPIAIVSAGDYGQALNGQVTSYDSGTGSLVVNVQRAVGSGTYSSWIVSYGHNIPQYDQAPYQNLFGHRNIGVGDPYNTDDHLNLIEGNRMGFASTNPNNDGSDNLTFTGHKNLARYNVLYGAMGTGIYFKWPYTGTYPGPGGVKNYVYNNTIYHSGYGWNPKLYGGGNLAYRGQGIGQNDYSATIPTNNVIKNNIVYGNSQGDICVIGWPGNATCSPALLSGGTPYDIVVNNWVTTGGDPKFVNPDLTDPTSQSLFSSVHGYTATPIPNLSLQSGSGAINAGVALTTASGAGASSTALVVADAMYFQDGSWGSDLARGVTLFPDWIAIGTVGNVVQVSSINYSTNTITLASPMTWSDGASVWLYKKSDGAVVLSGSAPDLGASEYISGTLMLGTFRGAIQ